MPPGSNKWRGSEGNCRRGSNVKMAVLLWKMIRSSSSLTSLQLVKVIEKLQYDYVVHGSELEVAY